MQDAYGGIRSQALKRLLKPHQEDPRIVVELHVALCRLNYHLVELYISTNTVNKFCEESDEDPTLVLGQCLTLMQSRLRRLGVARCQVETLKVRNIIKFSSVIGSNSILL